MRAVFVATLALFIVQHVVRSRASEPFPALFAPGFGTTDPAKVASAPTTPGKRVELQVVFRGGGQERLALQSLLEGVRQKQRPLVERAFVRALRAARGEQEIAGWLRARLSRRYPARTPHRLHLTTVDERDRARSEPIWSVDLQALPEERP